LEGLEGHGKEIESVVQGKRDHIKKRKYQIFKGKRRERRNNQKIQTVTISQIEKKGHGE
jgi:hypothetical protein